jgi:hypothetical protein
MATYIRSVRNNRPNTVYLRVPGFDPLNPLFIASEVTVDLLSVTTADTLAAMQRYLAALVAAGELTVTATIDSAALYLPVPSVSSSVNAIAVASDVTDAVLFTPAATGMYSVSVYAVCTASATGGDVAPTLLVGWTDETGFNQNYVATPLGANATLITYEVFPVWDIAGNPIVYTLQGGVYGTLRYNLHFVVEQL